MAGFRISSRDGKRPWSVRVLVAAWLVCFVVAFGLIIWRDFAAPHVRSPEYPDVFRGKNDAVYYVPGWFTPLFVGCICVIGAASVGIPVLQIFFFAIEVKRRLTETPRYSPPSGP